MFLIYQPEDGQCKVPKHVVVLYVINYTYLYHHTVVLDRYTHCNLVYYKHNGVTNIMNVMNLSVTQSAGNY